jgi:FlgD Ig-like domain
MKRLLTLLIPVFIAIFSIPAHGASLTFNATRDNTIYAESDTLSNGAGQRVFAGENGTGFVRRALIRFDLNGLIYSGAVIDSVVLRLNVVQTHPTSRIVTVYRLLDDWGEGTTVGSGGEGGGGLASPGSATWLQRFYLAPFAPWTTPGGDYNAAASASRPVGSVGAYTWRSPALTADVAFWLANPAQNFGWELLGDETTGSTAKAFASRQNSTATVRPLLTVYYRIPSGVGATPAATRLFPVHPNPFNPSASIRYQLAWAERVNITVFDAAGRRVKTLVDDMMPSGAHEIVWHGDDAHGMSVASGVYMVKLVTANGAPQTEKMVLVK